MAEELTSEIDCKDSMGAFRDGGRMGLRGETGPIYQALRHAAKK
jgi:hypothetical protein